MKIKKEDIYKENKDLDLLTINDLENLLQISRRTIDRYCKNPEINFPKKIKIGKNSRFRKTDIQNWLSNHCINAFFTKNNKNHKVIESNVFQYKLVDIHHLTTKKEMLEILKNWKITDDELKELNVICWKIGNFLYFNKNKIEYDYLYNKYKIKMVMLEQQRD